jgi:DNA uptake protein ComE-like DNA-binding protein
VHPRHVLKLKTLVLIAFLSCAIACTTKKETPDDVREKTANATAELKENAKAVAEGVKEGLHRGDTVDLNKASKSDLMGLPGLTREGADRVIAGRPYDDAHQVVSRHALSQAQYDRIKDQVTVSH